MNISFMKEKKKRKIKKLFNQRNIYILSDVSEVAEKRESLLDV